MVLILWQSFEQEFYNRAAQLETVKQTASELIKKANANDAALLETQLNEVDDLWDKVKKLAEHRSDKLLDALKDVSLNASCASGKYSTISTMVFVLCLGRRVAQIGSYVVGMVVGCRDEAQVCGYATRRR